MKVSTFIENVKDRRFEVGKELEIKKYISIMKKKAFVMDVIAACTDDIDDFIAVDRFKMGIYFDMNMLKEYTNLEIESDFDEMIAQYDELCESGLLNKVIDLFKDEYVAMSAVLEDKIDEILIQNSIEAQVVKVANKIINTTDAISSIDLSKIIPDGMDAKELLSVFFNLLK